MFHHLGLIHCLEVKVFWSKCEQVQIVNSKHGYGHPISCSPPLQKCILEHFFRVYDITGQPIVTSLFMTPRAFATPCRFELFYSIISTYKAQRGQYFIALDVTGKVI